MHLRYYNTKTNNIYKLYIQYLQIRDNMMGNWAETNLCQLVVIKFWHVHNWINFCSCDWIKMFWADSVTSFTAFSTACVWQGRQEKSITNPLYCFIQLQMLWETQWKNVLTTGVQSYLFEAMRSHRCNSMHRSSSFGTFNFFRTFCFLFFLLKSVVN